jgi:hypothetical protein
MKIAILGWGSLTWRPGVLPLATEWRKGGPLLPLEFSRISRSRGGALTVVIDPAHGAQVATRFATSQRSDLGDAIEDLRNREHTELERIGYVDLEEQCQICRVFPEAAQSIGQWGKRNGFAAVVWTDLPTNFTEKRGGAFSVAEAVRYLMSLREPSAGMAREYLLRAPLEIATPLRERLWMHPWLWS